MEFHQIMIAEQVYSLCVEKKKKAHIINMGSTADTGQRKKDVIQQKRKH